MMRRCGSGGSSMDNVRWDDCESTSLYEADYRFLSH